MVFSTAISASSPAFVAAASPFHSATKTPHNATIPRAMKLKTAAAPGGLHGRAASPAPPKAKGIEVDAVDQDQQNRETLLSVGGRLNWGNRSNGWEDESCGWGVMVHGEPVFRQNFTIHSYEVGVDGTASLETLMNHLQETSLNTTKTRGLQGEGFGPTPEMSKRNLIWVVSKMQILVNRYPTWGDNIQAEILGTSPSGKNAVRTYCLLRDCKTRDILARASSLNVMINKVTRKFSKIPEEVQGEIEFYLKDVVVDNDDFRRLPKLDHTTADCIRTGLTPRWGDLDLNNHVNNAKYFVWIMESVASSILEAYELVEMALEFKRECDKESILESLTKVVDVNNHNNMECVHLLRLESGQEIMRAKSKWTPKRKA